MGLVEERAALITLLGITDNSKYSLAQLQMLASLPPNDRNVSSLFNEAGQFGPGPLPASLKSDKIRTSCLVAAIGTSVMAGGGSIDIAANNAAKVYPPSPLLQAVLASSGKLRYSFNAAVPGNTSAQILASVATIIALNPLPDFCLVDMGENETTLAAILPFVPQVVNALRAGGVEPVFCTIPPSSDTNQLSNGIAIKIRSFNGWLRSYCQQRKILLVDTFAALTNPATGYFNVGSNADVTHPNAVGLQAMGVAISAALTSIVTPANVWLASDAIDPLNMVLNPVITNGLTNWTRYGASDATESVVTDANFIGSALLVTRTGGSAVRVAEQNISSGFSVGDKLSFSAKVTTAGVANAGANVIAYVLFVGATGFQYLCYVYIPVDQAAGAIYFEGVVPVGTTSLQVQMRGQDGNGTTAHTYKFGQVGIRNLTTNNQLSL